MDYNEAGFTDYKGHNLLCAVELATGKIEPWACAQMSEADLNYYKHAPFICPSYDGKRVYFNSAWRSSTASDNAHLYVVRHEA
jgi:hypothetical protein